MKHKIAQVKQEKRKGKNVTVITREKTHEEKQADLEARVVALEQEVTTLKAQMKAKA